MDKVTMLLVLLVLPTSLPPHVEAFDGCDDSRSVRCGDTCSTRDKYCQCGNATETLEQYRKSYYWCCIPPSANCSDTGGNITCPAGTLQLLTQPCHGACNYWPEDVNSASHSYQLCDAAVNISTSQCVRADKYGDNAYDCWDRSDEQPFQEKDKQKARFLSQPTDCTDTWGNPGLSCSGYTDNCLPYAYWCVPSNPFSCPEELGNHTDTLNPNLCGDYVFWAGRPCRHSELGEGERCRGRSSGQCVHPTSEHKNARRYCDDKSDNIFTANTTCPAYSIDSHPHCSARLSTYCDYTRDKYSSYYHYWHLCLSCLDPANCAGSCAPQTNISPANYSSVLHKHCEGLCDPAMYAYDLEQCQECLDKSPPSCKACSNRNYYQCEKSGQCIHPDLRCDMHPQCMFAEDEQGCEKEYKERGFVPEEALYR
jgi:hypothetical protein